MARHRKYSRKRRGQKRNRMRSRKMRGGFDDEPNMPELRLSDLEEEEDEDKKRPSPFDSPELTKERKRQNIGPKEILRYDNSDSDSDIDEDEEQLGGKRRRKRRRTNKRRTRKSRKTRKNRKRRQRGGIVTL
jgi:hypothetical protein